ncbi:hypothetical protein C8J57DRAFT_1232203 [Mycena rebaudengoi]|nr:hypothetical protein C8J57DRAFT_1232203 [Mycena rebaudengoi]
MTSLPAFHCDNFKRQYFRRVAQEDIRQQEEPHGFDRVLGTRIDSSPDLGSPIPALAPCSLPAPCPLLRPAPVLAQVLVVPVQTRPAPVHAAAAAITSATPIVPPNVDTRMGDMQTSLTAAMRASSETLLSGFDGGRYVRLRSDGSVVPRRFLVQHSRRLTFSADAVQPAPHVPTVQG